MKSLALAGVSLASFSLMGVVPVAPALAATPDTVASTSDSGTMQRVGKDEARVLKKLLELGSKPIGTQSVEETRKGPSPADAVKAVLKDEGKDPAALKAAMKITSQDTTYPTTGGTQPARIYSPEGAPSNLPVIMFIHGGGWVIADIDTYEASAMALAKKTQAIVVSIDYRHAPENKFPAAHEDAFNAYKWILENASKWGGDPKRVALAGESAGGNLATNVAIMARDEKLQSPRAMLIVYPVAATNTDTPSYRKNEHAVPLSKPAMEWFIANTIRTDADKLDPRLDLVGKAKLGGLPPATVITDDIDPLMSEGKALADALKKAGNKVTYENYSGVTHEFFGMDAVVKKAEEAQALAAKNLKAALAK